MATRTREQRAASALKLVAKEGSNDEAVQLALDTLEQCGLSKRDLVIATVDRAGGILGSSDVAKMLSGEGKEAAPTNVKRLTHGQEPFARASSSPLWLVYEILPHRERLLDKRVKRIARSNGTEVETVTELPDPVPFDRDMATA